MVRADAGTEALRRAGLFAGAVLLASWFARSLYFLAGCRFGGGAPADQLPRAMLLIAICFWIIIAVRDRFLKAAALAFVGEYALALLPTLLEGRPFVALQTTLAVAGAGFLVVAGARHRTARTLALAAAVFIAATAFDVGLIGYGMYLLSGRSVMHAFVWRGGRCL